MPQLSIDMWAYGVLAVVLIAASITDVRSEKIPNVITYPAILLGIVGHALITGIWSVSEVELGLVGSLGGFAAGFLPLLAAFLVGGIGGGDAKLMGAVGALAGWRFAIAAMLYGFGIAALMALVIMIARGVVRRTLGRIFRFVYLMFTPSRPADPATADSPKVPFGLALCIGSAIALAEVLIHGPVAMKLWGHLI